MIAALLSLLLFADPYWVSTPARQWTDAQLIALLSNSPWAQPAEGPGQNAPPVEVYLATAAPIQLAEAERDRRLAARRRPGAPASDNSEYKLWMEDNRAGQIVLAVRMPNTKGFLDEQEVQKMERETAMRAGKKKIKLTGSFPPTDSDPYLRLAFARQVELSDKNLVFELYLPGVPAPYRTVEFRLKDMVSNGKLEL